MSDEIPEERDPDDDITDEMFDAAWDVMKFVESMAAMPDDAARIACVIVIARAFLAQREQCACIAESNNAWPSEGADIAAAIRGDGQ